MFRYYVEMVTEDKYGICKHGQYNILALNKKLAIKSYVSNFALCGDWLGKQRILSIKAYTNRELKKLKEEYK